MFSTELSVLTPDSPYSCDTQVDQDAHNDKWNEHIRREYEQIVTEAFRGPGRVSFIDPHHNPESDVGGGKDDGDLRENPP